MTGLVKNIVGVIVGCICAWYIITYSLQLSYFFFAGAKTALIISHVVSQGIFLGTAFILISKYRRLPTAIFWLGFFLFPSVKASYVNTHSEETRYDLSYSVLGSSLVDAAGKTRKWMRNTYTSPLRWIDHRNLIVQLVIMLSGVVVYPLSYRFILKKQFGRL